LYYTRSIAWPLCDSWASWSSVEKGCSAAEIIILTKIMHPGSERGAVGESCGAGNTIPVCEVRSGNCWKKRSQRRTPSTVRNHLSFWLQKNHTGVEEYGLDEFAQMLRHGGDVDALRTAAVTHDVTRSSTSITTIINISRTLASPMRCKNASRRKNYNFSLDTTRAVTAAPASLAVEPSACQLHRSASSTAAASVERRSSDLAVSTVPPMYHLNVHHRLVYLQDRTTRLLWSQMHGR